MARKSKIERFPNRIRELREQAELSLEKLGQLSGIHFSNLAKIETGEREMKDHHMEQLSKALGIAKADLLNPEDGGLTPEERALIDTYRDLPVALRKTFDALRDSHQVFRGSGEVISMIEAESERKRA
ncbi:helix-turn-helix transcriptional regulator [Novosphingobium sp. ST904]|uniref:helix-turn-helix domain-containing protein n=1 Tax=Novosphingobium sp. ST904 TaxID=1684385 RepID=UPI0006C8BD6F|nr:helix-turn-helix transcriptional regulator [Novosphingobium sp. ST904]KPH59169.1 hypothetical protein ADT71_23785 [Novosphingobium sp. ST904]